MAFNYVDIHLREGETQTFLREGLVNQLVHAEIHVPIVFRLHPCPDGDIDRTVAHLKQLYDNLRLFQDTRVGIAEMLEYGLGMVVVVAVGDGKHPIDAAVGFFVEVGHHPRRECPVGQDNRLVVRCKNNRVEDLYRADLAFVALRLDVVAHLERAEKHDHHSAGEVLQSAAQGHAHRQSR